MTDDVLEIAKGTDATFYRQIRNDDGTPATGYLVTDTFKVELWPGGDAAPIAQGIGVVWGYDPDPDASQGKFRIVPAPADTSALTSGLYNLRITVLRDGSPSKVVYDGGLDVTVSPGTAALGKTYCTYQDMRDIADWVGAVQSLGVNTTGFRAQRVAARNWLDHVFLRNYRQNSIGRFGSHSWSAMNWAYGSGIVRALTPNPAIQAYLDADKLMVTPQVVRVCALYAIAQVGLTQIGQGNQYAGLGCYFREMAENELGGMTLQIDPDGTGYGPIYCDLSQVDTPFA